MFIIIIEVSGGILPFNFVSLLFFFFFDNQTDFPDGLLRQHVFLSKEFSHKGREKSS